MAHLLFVVAPFYREYADDLVAGAAAACKAAGAKYDVMEVPGALEIPGAIRLAMQAERYDGYVALGCVIRGETYHFEVVCNESARGLMDLAVHYGACIGNGILTCEDDAQAAVRANPKQKNKGGEAAQACLAMIALAKKYEDAA